MCVWASSGASPPTSSWSSSNHGTMPLSSITAAQNDMAAHRARPVLALRRRSLEQEVRRLAALADERELPDHRHEQSLRVHVAGLDLDGLDLAGQHVLHLLAVLVEVAPVHHRRPYGLLELRLGVAEQVRERLVELLEAPVEGDARRGLLHV